METKTSSQTKARLIVVTVFVIGFAAGALAATDLHAGWWF